MNIDDPISSDINPWMNLLGAVISQIRLDAIALRRKRVLDNQGRLTVEGEQRFPRIAKRAEGKAKVSGIERRDEVIEIGRMIYQGGMDRLLRKLGLPEIGYRIKANVEAGARTKSRYSR